MSARVLTVEVLACPLMGTTFREIYIKVIASTVVRARRAAVQAARADGARVAYDVDGAAERGAKVVQTRAIHPVRREIHCCKVCGHDHPPGHGSCITAHAFVASDDCRACRRDPRRGVLS